MHPFFKEGDVCLFYFKGLVSLSEKNVGCLLLPLRGRFDARGEWGWRFIVKVGLCIVRKRRKNFVLGTFFVLVESEEGGFLFYKGKLWLKTGVVGVF